jgi:hypothetical protein
MSINYVGYKYKCALIQSLHPSLQVRILEPTVRYLLQIHHTYCMYLPLGHDSSLQ